MNFLAPAFFYAALGVAASTVALHFLVTRQPRSSDLPTARFVPDGAVRTVTTSRRPEDLLALLVRVLLVLLAGAAFARPVWVSGKRPVVRLVVADVSRAAGSLAEVRDSVRALLREGDALIAFDSTARLLDASGVDSLARTSASPRPSGRLSPALVVALRTATALRARADSFELAIVSPLAAAEMDAATTELRALWPGRVRLVPVAAARMPAASPTGAAVMGSEDDAVRVGAASAGLLVGSDAAVRVVRTAPTGADSAWASATGHTLVRWPADGAAPGWTPRAAPDTAGAVVADGVALVAPIERRWQRAPNAPPARVVARWVDGEPAATERAVGAGCVRDVAIAVPTRGDLILRPGFGRLLAALVRPCDALLPMVASGSAERTALAGAGPLVAATRLPELDAAMTPLVPWLLAAALALALLEPWVRARGASVRDDESKRVGTASTASTASVGPERAA